MVNKFLLLMLLLGWGASAQVYHVDCKTDSLVSYLASKDAKITNLSKTLGVVMKTSKKLSIELMDAKDSLYYYKKYYVESKKVLSPRIIARIEDEVRAN